MTTVDVSEPVVGLADLGVFGGLRGARRDEAFMAVEREVRRLRGLQAAMLSEVTRSGSFVDDFHRSATSWVRAVSNSTKSTALHRSQVAAMLQAMPVLAAAVVAGQIGDDQLVLLRRLWANDRCRKLLPDSDGLLTGHARSLTVHDFGQVCRRWQAHADPDGAHRDHEQSRANRHVRTSQFGAGAELHAEGDALTVEMIKEILARHAEAEFDDDLSERVRRYGDTADQHPLPRTARQRLYDAMVTIFMKAAGTTAAANQTPLVNIFCTESGLADAIRDYAGIPADPSDQPPVSQRLRLCETASGAPVDPHDLAVAALIGQVRRVVVDSAGRVIDLGRRSRLFVGAAREAVLLAGDRCTHPGCELRIPRIQIDHSNSWARHCGGTNPFNGGPKCPRHNLDKELGHFSVKRDETGWHHYRPDGTEIAPRHQPPP